MRLLSILAILPLPAAAWDFTPDPICTLIHQAEAAEIVITYDASLPEYALFLTLRSGVWPDSPSFTMSFEGGRDLSIGTTRHSLSADGVTLTVRDRGFGNVLDGIEFNQTLRAASGAINVQTDTSDAKEAIALFRECPRDVPATS